MTALPATARLRPSRHIVGRQLDESYFLLNLETNRLFELNSTGLLIWELVEQGLDRAAIENRLAQTFDAEPGAIARDVGELLEALVQERMLLVEEAGVDIAPDREPQPPPPHSWLLRWAPDDEEPRVFGADVAELDSGFAAVAGYLFGSGGAAEVAEAYRARGAEFADELRGSFCAAVFDRRTAALHVARDATGMRPCFYTWDGKTIHVSSSVDTLLALPGVSRDVNRVVLAEYLHGRCPQAQRHETFYREVSRLPPAHRLEVKERTLRVSRYWDPVPEDFAWASADEVDSIPELLAQAVSRCRAAGADCIALSGGFDSVSLAVLAAEATPPLAAVSLRMTGTESDEGAVQRAVAGALDMPMLMVDAGDMIAAPDFIDRALEVSAYSPSPVLSMWQWIYSALVTEARAAGYRNMMLGTGGDEMFVVDPRYAQDLIRGADMVGLYQLGRAWQRTSPFSAATVAKELLWKHGVRAIAAGALRRVVPGPARDLVRRALGRQRWQLAPAPDLAAAMNRRVGQDAPADLYRELMRRLAGDPNILIELDQAAAWAAHSGIGLHYPFYDRDVISVALRAHPRDLYRSGRMKSPLRELVAEGLPSVAMPETKVDFSRAAHAGLRQSIAGAWQRLGGAKKLAEMNIARPDRTEHLVDRYAKGAPGGLRSVWTILAAESWLRARDSHQALP